MCLTCKRKTKNKFLLFFVSLDNTLIKTGIMLEKKTLQKYIDDLPERFSIDELLDKILFLQKVETGLTQSKNNKGMTQEDMKKKYSKWLK